MSNDDVVSAAVSPMNIGATAAVSAASARAVRLPPSNAAKRAVSHTSAAAANATGRRSANAPSPVAYSPAASSGTAGGWST